jgi:predicted RNase H-like HicB family nuclease
MSKRSLPAIQRQSMEEATAEAEARPIDYDPKMRATTIRKMLEDIPLWMAQGDTEEVIRARIPEWVEQYPELFKKIIQRQDLTPIHAMLTMLDKMAVGGISQHQASVVVGKKLVDRFVTPQLNGAGARKSEP